jgi:hypothetical protein
MENAPEIPTAVEVKLYNFSLLDTNTFRLWIEFEPGVSMSLDFPAGSEASERILEFLTEITTRRFNELGRRGVVISDFTPPEHVEVDEAGGG